MKKIVQQENPVLRAIAEEVEISSITKPEILFVKK